MADEIEEGTKSGIAIVGMAGRFPGASTLDQYWLNLVDGVESVTHLSDKQLVDAGINPELLANPDYVKARALLDDADMFDAAFFGFNPRDADITDPQQRIFLEVSWEALENAGYDPERYGRKIGVFAGSGMNTYLLSNLLHDRALVQDLVGAYQVSNYNLVVGNDKDYLATRVSYKLNLKGPGVTVQSACSTSLVAVCQAVESLLSKKCDMALAGGVSISFPQERGYLYSDGGMAALDGHCRPFDEEASGVVFGSGAAVVVLKRLEDAVADGDTIAGVILGVGINNDGSQKVSYLAPSAEGQAEAITMALLSSGVDPESISYVEAHGTGTPLGDPIELAGLTKAFRALGATRSRYCGIGSVKSNIGHLAEAAGAAGLIKTVLAMQHGQLPPSINYKQPNFRLEIGSSPFYVVDQLTPWITRSGVRRAGVSAFGVGGTNAHVIVEEAPLPIESTPGAKHQIIALSAKSPAALDAASERLAEYLTQNPEVDLSDVAYTLQVGRREFLYRRTVVASTPEYASRLLREQSATASVPKEASQRTIAFLFPGQGSQHVNMGRELYESVDTFRADVDVCAELLKDELGIDLRTILYPDSADESLASGLLTETRYTQPALFTVEYAMAMLWMDWGFLPDAMIGHSVGEYVAATLSGVLSLPDALRLLAIRARLMQALPSGSMLAVRAPAGEVSPLLADGLSIAALNSPILTVVSGRHEPIAELEAQLTRSGIQVRRLHTSHAFHSSMMEPMMNEYRKAFDGVELSSPVMPFVSNVTGSWITPDLARDPEYWVRHVRVGVNFAAGISTLLDREKRTLLEVGPGNALATLSVQNAKGLSRSILSSAAHLTSEASQSEYFVTTLGRLWEQGARPDWEAVHRGERRRRLPLPTYPFERKRHWVEPTNVYRTLTAAERSSA